MVNFNWNCSLFEYKLKRHNVLFAMNKSGMIKKSLSIHTFCADQFSLVRLKRKNGWNYGCVDEFGFKLIFLLLIPFFLFLSFTENKNHYLYFLKTFFCNVALKHARWIFPWKRVAYILITPIIIIKRKQTIRKTGIESHEKHMLKSDTKR